MPHEHHAFLTLPWWVPYAVAIALSVVVVVIELKTDSIPKTITLGLLFAAGCLGILDMKLVSHFGGFVISAIVCGVLYRRDALGGGGLKWTCALSTLLGIRDGVVMMIVAGLIGGAWLGVQHLRRRHAWYASSPLLLAGICAALANVVAEQRAWW